MAKKMYYTGNYKGWESEPYSDEILEALLLDTPELPIEISKNKNHLVEKIKLTIEIISSSPV